MILCYGVVGCVVNNTLKQCLSVVRFCLGWHVMVVILILIASIWLVFLSVRIASYKCVYAVNWYDEITMEWNG